MEDLIIFSSTKLANPLGFQKSDVALLFHHNLLALHYSRAGYCYVMGAFP
jgi:hypothetical protein